MTDIETLARHLVQNEVHLCVSSIVSTLAMGHGCITVGEAQDLSALCDRALELAAPIEDWEAAAFEAGWTKTPEGRFWREPQDDETIPAERLETFMGSGPFVWADDAQDACDFDGLPPAELEVYEHHAVSAFLADDLEALGERIDRDFAGLIVWARTTTGQAIYADAVMIEVAQRLQART